ncbi:osmoprotectant ABC transporter substrate-binding protein [Neobacillus cucumis]|uniref:glycine betaine ABC transporter substrate-binding protein n=1 Tax=Neobacillus cucumis TaxID=1740721 RepID=UPI0018DFCE84|nr:glycine betaine ABC transporter substrate-binding protein [Neobacillus cucumis]MBI0577388.1 osmoprotectant ABC transporter substrate-binding protein [Neobacillus cucumis]WHY90890.1 glycine betaine ABC transporter substrate-binding protein [Neobacillus cucumis]
MKKFIGVFVLVFTLLVSLAGCGKSDTVNIGSQSFSEQLILSNMVKLLIEDKTDLKAKIVEGLGSTPVVHKAQTKGDIQVSIRYVGTDLSGTLGMTSFPTDPKESFDLVSKEFEKKYKQTWMQPFGFENTYAFTVRQELADKLHLEKVSDIAPEAGKLSLGTDNAWLERPQDGYPAFEKTYGVKFGKTSPMDIGLVYKAVKNKDVDVVLAYSTDSRLKQYNLKTLTDDKKFFPSYQCATVVSDDLLKKHPDLKGVMSKLSGLIDSKTMTDLNYKADIEKKEPNEIAKEFLIEKGLIKK